MGQCQGRARRNVPLGVRLAVIEDILEQGGHHRTTENISQKFIKVQTEKTQSAYINLVEPSMVGPATCFISHAWKYDLADCVDVMRQYEAEHPNTFFWFDLVVNNQHKATNYPFEWWCSTFQQSIEAIGTVVLVLTPWNDPIPLSRSWCLFEIMCSLNAGAKVDFQIRLPTHQHKEFVAGMEEDYQSALNALVKVKTELSEASNKSDQENIFRAVETSVGFQQLNSLINEQLRAWFLTRGELAAKSMEESGQDLSRDTDYSDLCLSVGSMLNGFGNHEKAHEYFQKAVVIQQRVLGEEHATTAETYDEFGLLFKIQGNSDKALEYYQKALAIRKKVLGEDHTSTAESYHNIGKLFHDIGKDDEALEYYQKVLAIRQKVLGEEHTSTADSYHNIGNVFWSKGQNDLGFVQIGAGSYGDVDDSVDNTGDYDKALEYYQKALAIYQMILGEEHTATADSYNDIGDVLNRKGADDEALEYYQKALAIRQKVLGEEHTSTADSYHNIGMVLKLQGDYDKALEYYQKAHAVRQKVFGNEHAGTQHTKQNCSALGDE